MSNSVRYPWSRIRTSLTFATALALAACGGSSNSPTGPGTGPGPGPAPGPAPGPSPSVGSVLATVSTTGLDLDRDGYAVALDGNVQTGSIPVNGSKVFTDIPTGDHSLELTGFRSNCSVGGSNPRTVTVTANVRVETIFDIVCTLRSIASVSVTPDTITGAFSGESFVLNATPFAADGDTITGASFTWESSDPLVATVDNGLVQSRAEGQATITATSGGVGGTTEVGVNPSLRNNARVSVELDPERPHQSDPYVVIDGTGRLVVGYRDTDFAGGAWVVASARSFDGGNTWSAHQIMEFIDPGGSRFQSDPWLAVDEFDRFYFSRVAFTQGSSNSFPSDGATLVSRSDDGGLNWAPPVRANSLAGFDDFPVISSDRGGTLYLGSQLFATGCCNFPTQAVVTSSVDGGLTWSSTVVANVGVKPYVAGLSNGTAVVAWIDGIVIRSDFSPDQGQSWNGFAAPVNPPGSVPRFHKIATGSNGRVYVAWIEFNTKTVISHSDGGITWSSPVVVNDAARGKRSHVSLAVDDNDDVHLAWYDTRTGLRNVVYARSTDGGDTWSANVRVTTRETDASLEGKRLSTKLGLAADGFGVAYVVWTDWRNGTADVYSARIP